MKTCSLTQANIAGRGVDHKDAQLFQLCDDELGSGPIVTKLLLILVVPFRPDIVGKLRKVIEVRAREIQQKRRFHNGHFQRQQSVVKSDEVRHLKAGDRVDAFVSEPQIYIALPAIRFLRTVNFQSGSTGIQIAFEGKNDTMNTKAESSGKASASPDGISFRSLDYVLVHPRVLQSKRALRRRKNTPAHRQRNPLRRPARTGLSDPEPADRPCAGRGGPFLFHRRQGAATTGAPTGRHIGSIAASDHHEGVGSCLFNGAAVYRTTEKLPRLLARSPERSLQMGHRFREHLANQSRFFCFPIGVAESADPGRDEAPRNALTNQKNLLESIRDEH